MNENIYAIIQSEYDKMRRDAYERLLLRKREVYSRIPELEQIEGKIAAEGIKLNKMILLGAGAGKDDFSREIAEELSFKIDELKNKKTKLLTGAGYPEDYLEPVYTCSECRDTGYVESGGRSSMCACYRQKLINLMFENSNLRLAQKENFSAFNIEYYPDTVSESRYGIKKSPRSQILEIKESCVKFIENFASPEEKNLFFCGPAGVGKTFMANCVAMELMKRGATVLYLTAPVLFSTINEFRSRSFKDEEFRDRSYKNILETELLIIDDLGTESPSAARYAELLTILNTRQNNNLSRPCKTIISTNIDIKKMYDYYDERIVSRIIGNFNMFRFAGDDIRKIKALREN